MGRRPPEVGPHGHLGTRPASPLKLSRGPVRRKRFWAPDLPPRRDSAGRTRRHGPSGRFAGGFGWDWLAIRPDRPILRRSVPAPARSLATVIGAPHPGGSRPARRE